MDLGAADFSPGLSFVAISRVKSLDGLAFRSRFDASRLQKVKETDTRLMLKEYYQARAGSIFHHNNYGVDLSEYTFVD